MPASKLITIVIILSALLVNCPATFAAGAGKHNPSHRGSDAHMSEKGSANNNAQWSADPERGWVRADQQQKFREKNRSTTEPIERYGKAKGKRKTN